MPSLKRSSSFHCYETLRLLFLNYKSQAALNHGETVENHDIQLKNQIKYLPYKASELYVFRTQ